MNAALLESWPLELLIKGAVLCLFWLAVAGLCRRASASVLRTVWRTLFAALFALGAVSFVPEAWRIHVAVLPVAEKHALAANVSPKIHPSESPTLPRSVSATEIGPNIDRRTPLPWCGLWGAGAALVLARAGLSAWRVHRLVGAALPVIDDAWIEDAEREGRRLGHARRIRLLWHPAVRAPFAVGWFRPSIVLPAGAECWESGRCGTVLHHEFEHVRNRDIAWQWLAEILAALNWPNPLLWIARRQLLLTQEMAVDDAVLAGGVEAVEYAELLTAAAFEGCSIARQPAFVPMAHQSNLGRRVAHVLDAAQQRGPAGVALRAVMGIAGFACVFLCGFLALRAAEGQSAAAAAGPAVKPADEFTEKSPARIRTYRDTLRLEPEFRTHFPGSTKEAIAGLRAAIASAQIDLPASISLELSPGKDTLVAEFPEKDQEAVEVIESLLIQLRWLDAHLLGKPKPGDFVATLKSADGVDEAAKRALHQYVDVIEKQQEKVLYDRRVANQLLQDAGCVDNDPLNINAQLTTSERYEPSSIPAQIEEQRRRVDSAKAELAAIDRLKPEEITTAQRILGLDDRVSERTLAQLNDASLAERKLVASGLDKQHPRVKELHASSEQYRQSLANELDAIRKSQTLKLRVAMDELEVLEKRLAAATETRQQTEKKLHSYLDAKSQYLDGKRLLDALTTQYQMEQIKYRLLAPPAGAPAKSEK